MPTQKFYLDNSENSSDKPEDALAWYETADDATEAARQAAIKAPGTIFLVHEVIETYRCIYKAEAEVNLTTEVIDGTPNQS